jgi:hypothetical protein
MARNLSLVLAGLLLTVGAGRGQDAYPIKVRDAGVGDTTLVQKTETTHGRTVVTDASGWAVVNGEQISTEVTVYRETVLAKDGAAPPTRLRRQYEKAQVQAPGRVADLPCAGKTVLIEKADGQYHFRFENGRELTAAEATALDREFNRAGNNPLDLEKLLLPRSAVRPHEAWGVDMATFVKEFGGDGEMEIEKEKATGNGVLNKVYQKDGRQFGDLSYQMDLPLKAMGRGRDRVELDSGSKIVFQAGMDLCIDGTAESAALNGVMKLSATGRVPLPDGKPGKAVITLEVQSQEVQSGVAK